MQDLCFLVNYNHFTWFINHFIFILRKQRAYFINYIFDQFSCRCTSTSYLVKALVPLVYLLLIFDCRTTHISNIQYVLVLLLIPAFFNLLVVEPLNIVRLFPLAYLILTSGTLRPFKRFTHVSRIIYYLILFIAISSFFLAIGNPIATGFRETFYPMDDSSFNYGS